MKRFLMAATLFWPVAFVNSCSDEPISNDQNSSLREAWDSRNAPERMGYDYIANTYHYKVKFSELPLTGALNKEPWSDDYWPTYKGGISYRWAQRSTEVERYGYDLLSYSDINERNISYLSPAEKFDLLLGNKDFSITKKERDRTQILRTVPGSSIYDPNYKIPTWEGLCHAWAPATILFDHPGPVTMKNSDGLTIPFGASDVKALLTYFLHNVNARTYFLGGRCNLNFGELQRKLRNGEISSEEYHRLLESNECRDANAGAFHIVLANQIGRMKQGFIVDVTKDAEVWNQAVHRFSSKIVNSRDYATEGAAPGTVREIDIETHMTYTVEVQQSWNRASPRYANRTVLYKYRLELNANGDIIGGAWYNNGRKDDRPDFLWKQDLPAFSGIYKVIEDLYKKSISQSVPDSRDNHDNRNDRDGNNRSGNDGNGRDNHAYLDANLSWRNEIDDDEMTIYVTGKINSPLAHRGRLTLYTIDQEKKVVDRFKIRPGRTINLSTSFRQGKYVAASLLAFDRDGRSLGGEIYEFEGISIPMDDLLTDN